VLAPFTSSADSELETLPTFRTFRSFPLLYKAVNRPGRDAEHAKEGFRYAILLKANPVLERKIAPLLKRPVGRPSRKPKKCFASFPYRAGSWEGSRRVVAEVEWHAGELFPRR
jgi:hypothetical protein